MRKVGMTYDKAFALCCKQRPDVCPIPAFEAQLRKYEAKCRKVGAIKDDEDSKMKKKRKAGTAIGPSIGPAMLKVQVKESPGDEAATGKNEEKSSKKMKGAPIGPAIGPSKVDMPEQNDEDDQKESSCADRSAVIGPSMGPATKQAER
mmetsp:Transcript_12707/g.17513  ORF Transcript_12707/g.17513 Transcript_12707/m.17513 type:complete len:148 (-) Transcript_12707:54-497(-)